METPEYKYDEATKSAALCGAIMLRVWDLGYDFHGELGLIDTIVKNNIDISKYELPYCAKNIDEWEKRALESKARLKEIDKQFNDVIKSGKVRFIAL